MREPNFQGRMWNVQQVLHILNSAVTKAIMPRAETARIIAKRHHQPKWKKPHQGVNEMARRRRQIEKGMLTVSNGLVLT